MRTKIIFDESKLDLEVEKEKLNISDAAIFLGKTLMVTAGAGALLMTGYMIHDRGMSSGFKIGVAINDMTKFVESIIDDGGIHEED